MKTLIGSSAIALALLGLAGCGDDGSVQDDPESATDCSDVWVAGETLPSDYEGCNDGDTFVVLKTVGDCELASYEGTEEFYANLGGTISKAVPNLAEDPTYGERGNC